MGRKIAIFGAGIAGLATGLALAEKGFDVTIFERASFVGGMAASFTYQGFVFDYGPHVFHAAKNENRSAVKRVLSMPDLEMTRLESRASIVFKGKIFDWPLRISSILQGLPKTYALLCVLDLMKARTEKKLFKKEPKNFEDFVKNEYGVLLYNEYFGPYTKKVWNADLKKLTAKFAEDRIPPISVLDVIFKSITGKEKSPFEKNHPHSPYKELYHPVKGYGAISEKFRDLFEKKSGRIFLRASVKKVVLGNSKIDYALVEQNGGEKKIEADFFVSTIPIDKFIDLMHPLPLRYRISSDENYMYRSLVLLYLVVNKPSVINGICMYVADQNFEFSRVSENKICGANVRFKEKTGICIEFPCFFEDAIWNSSKEHLVKIASDGLEKLNLLKREDIKGAELKRLPNAYSISTGENEKQMLILKEFFGSIQNLSTVGRAANFKYANIDELIKDGFEEAEKISSALR